MANKISARDVIVPLDVPWCKKGKYIKNYLRMTNSSGNLMLFAGDQKVEHLNADFFGDGIAADDNTPEHLFKIASQAKIGCFASQMGLIARYGMDYKNIPYLVKINSKSSLVKTEQRDPVSKQWVSVKDVVCFQKNSGLNIVGVGYTIYLGSEFETVQLVEAAQIVNEAHKNGLVTVFWIYPRGRAIKDERDPHLIAGATGTAACLGTDFVKVNSPKVKGQKAEELFKEAVAAAGRTKVVCAGGESTDVKSFLETLYAQIHIAGACGNATGRNIHQKPLAEAIRFCNAIYAITVDGKSVDEALQIYNAGADQKIVVTQVTADSPIDAENSAIKQPQSEKPITEEELIKELEEDSDVPVFVPDVHKDTKDNQNKKPVVITKGAVTVNEHKEQNKAQQQKPKAPVSKK